MAHGKICYLEITASVLFIGVLSSSLPSPHRTVLRINDVVGMSEPALRENMRRGIRDRESVRAD